MIYYLNYQNFNLYIYIKSLVVMRVSAAAASGMVGVVRVHVRAWHQHECVNLRVGLTMTHSTCTSL